MFLIVPCTYPSRGGCNRLAQMIITAPIENVHTKTLDYLVLFLDRPDNPWLAPVRMRQLGMTATHRAPFRGVPFNSIVKSNDPVVGYRWSANVLYSYLMDRTSVIDPTSWALELANAFTQLRNDLVPTTPDTIVPTPFGTPLTVRSLLYWIDRLVDRETTTLLDYVEWMST